MGAQRTAAEDENPVSELDHGEGAGDIHEVDNMACGGEGREEEGEAVEYQQEGMDGDD